VVTSPAINPTIVESSPIFQPNFTGLIHSNMPQALEARRSDAMSRYRPLRSKRAVTAQRSPLVGAQRLGVLAAVTGGAKLWPARE
jgi:hypothetical protein